MDKYPQTNWHQFTLFVVASVFALIFGVIAVTSNLVLVGLAIGLILGVFLLRDPKKTIWLVIGLGLIAPAMLDMLGSGFYKILWAISIMSMLLWLPGLIHIVDANLKIKQDIPIFVWIVLVFFGLALTRTLLNLHSLGEFSTGLRRYFQAYGLMLVLVTLVLTRADFNRWLKFLLVIALLQFPFALYERIILVAKRDTLASWGASATDVVAGTFGANLYTGSPNAVMVVFILLATAFLISRWRFGLLKGSRMAMLTSIILMPLFLGETKIVIVLIPIMTIVLFRQGLFDDVLKTFSVFTVMALLTVIIAYFYIYVMLKSNFADAFFGVMRYNIGNVGYGDNILNRFTVMTLWWDLHGLNNPMELLFGHGLGSSYGSSISTGHIAQQYHHYGINLTTVSTILWDLGVIGLVVYVSIFVVMWVQLNKIFKLTNNAIVKADCLSIQVGIAFTMLFLFYSDSQVNLLSHEIIVGLLIGYAGFLYQEQKRQLIIEPST